VAGLYELGNGAGAIFYTWATTQFSRTLFDSVSYIRVKGIGNEESEERVAQCKTGRMTQWHRAKVVA
jgi:hypothetical protein